MSDVGVFGFQRRICVSVIRLILTKKEIDFHFHDTGNEGKNLRPRVSRVDAWKPKKRAAERGSVPRLAAAEGSRSARPGAGSVSPSAGVSAPARAWRRRVGAASL
jgi:hypothetical protein